MSDLINPKHRISAHRTYFQIARINQDLYHQCKKSYVARESSIGEAELQAAVAALELLDQQRWQAAMIAVTLAGMTLEAFFYDYAAEQLGDQHVKEHLDKLALPSKYLVYPRLVCGKAPNKSEHTYGLVKGLTRLRNDLVHAKSKAFPLEQIDAAAAHFDEYHARLDKGIDEAVECVLSVMREFDKLHGMELFEKSILAY